MKNNGICGINVNNVFKKTFYTIMAKRKKRAIFAMD